MTDIIERLNGTFRAENAALNLISEAADEITALRAEVERLRGALEQIRDLPGEINTGNYDHDDVVTLNNALCEAFHISSAALGEHHD